MFDSQYPFVAHITLDSQSISVVLRQGDQQGRVNVQTSPPQIAELKMETNPGANAKTDDVSPEPESRGDAILCLP
jgi:hypothetical protein